MAEITLTLAEALTLALASHRAGDLAQAERIYRKIIGAKPDHFEALHSLGVIRYRCGHPEEADLLIKRAIALKPDHALAYNNRGNALRELKRPEEALASFDKAIALKSDYADAYYNRGNALRDLKRLDEAVASFDTAIALKPDADAYNNRGNVLRNLKRSDEALASFDEAITLNSDYAEAHNNRGNALRDLKRFDEALTSYDKAIALKPDYAVAYNNRGNALQDLMRLDDALASYAKAIELKPDYADAYYNHSFCLLLMGRFEQGWRQYEWRQKMAGRFALKAYSQSLCSQSLWLGNENITGKTLFIYWEQGLGDTIQFCRYGKLINAFGAKVLMSVQEPLYELLKQISPEIKIISYNEVPSTFDYHCPMMSLPLALGTTLETIPSEQCYIFADEQLRKVWDVRLPPQTKPRVGVVWSGNPIHYNDHDRSIDLATLRSLFSTDVHWISLQKELRHSDLASLRAFPQIVFLGDELRNFSDTAAVIDLLDLVITVDTAVAHLAGAMGKQVWVLLPYIPDWRWLLDRGDSPWYPSARLFRQDDTRSWGNVVERVHAALCDFVQSQFVPSMLAPTRRSDIGED